MTTIELIKITSICLIPMSLLILLIRSLEKQVNKDWKTLKYLEEKCKTVKDNKEDIEIFHKELLEKSKNIHNQFINLRLYFIDGYLRGLYHKYRTHD